jgi:DNA polymerase-3 subunit epsilon
LKLTDENFPRLIVSKGAPLDPTGALGPINGGAAIEGAMTAIHELLPLRQCKPKITSKSIKSASPCILYEINRCGAPCIGNQSVASYEEIIAKLKYFLEDDFRSLSEISTKKMEELALAERFEDAIEIRDRYGHLIRAASRIERLKSLTAIPLMIVAREVDDYWEFIAIKFGKLAATNRSTATTSVSDALSALKVMAEQVPNSGFLQQVNHEEVELILNYLENHPVRLVELQGVYAFPVFGPNSQATKFISREKLEITN